MKHTVKILILLLCLALSLSLGACGVREVPTVMEYGGVRLDEQVYAYWLACYRAQFAYQETPENMARLAEISDLNIKKTLVAAALFDGYGLQLDTAARDIINAAMASLEENAGGTREALEQAAATYGIDYEGLRLAVTLEQKATALFNYLFGAAGSITDEQYEAYYQKTYSRVRMVYISYVDLVLDEDGERVWDPATGTYLSTPKTGEALAEQEEKAAAVRAGISNGMSEEDFEALVTAYDEDPATKSYPNGFYFSEEVDYTDYIEELPRAALALSPGETAEVQSDYGVHFLLSLPCDEGAYAEEANADFFDGFEERTARYFYEALITARTTGVTVYHEVKDKIRYENVTPNFDLYW